MIGKLGDNMIKCISFDFDRTLAHVTPPTHKLVPQLLNSKGITITEKEIIQKYHEIHTNLPPQLANSHQFYGTLSKEKRREFIALYNRHRLDSLDIKNYKGNLDQLKDWVVEEILAQQKKILFDDVIETIEKLAKMNLKLYVLSGNHSDGIIELLEKANINHFFEEIITVDKYTSSKINNFKYLLEHSKFSPDEIIHIGDDFHTDGFGPHKNSINALIIQRPGLIFNNSNKNSHDFTIITKLEEIFNHI